MNPKRRTSDSPAYPDLNLFEALAEQMPREHVVEALEAALAAYKMADEVGLSYAANGLTRNAGSADLIRDPETGEARQMINGVDYIAVGPGDDARAKRQEALALAGDEPSLLSDLIMRRRARTFKGARTTQDKVDRHFGPSASLADESGDVR